jgi:hypothetical protein
MNRLFIAVALLLASAPVIATPPAGTAFQPSTKEYVFTATTSSGTPQEIVPIGYTEPTVYRIFCEPGTGTVTWAYGLTQASVTTVTAPTGATPQSTITLPAGQTETFNLPTAVWLNTLASTGTITCTVIGGIGQ